MDDLNRRKFLEFLGRGSLLALGVSAWGPLWSCSSAGRAGLTDERFRYTPIRPTSEDRLALSPELSYEVLAQWGDVINSRGERFGFNCDFTAFLPGSTPDEGILWVNHEYVDPLFVSGRESVKGIARSREEVRKEQELVGGSILAVRRLQSGFWAMVPDHPLNRRITGRTPIPISSSRPIEGRREAIGTVGNCGGGVTPWGTILTCEENASELYGERDYSGGKKGGILTNECYYGWEKPCPYPPEHYGWVVEVEPRTGKARKLTSLGRFGHESATVVQARDGRCVVYSGDDAADRCLYKFIASQPGNLETGTLYVANIARGKWIPLDLEQTPSLKPHFEDQLDLLIRARFAALIAGGSQLDRPEDIDVDPRTGSVFVTLTNNAGKGNVFGSILKIEERDADPLALEFHASTFLSGGPETGFACPDNIAFAPNGDLWFTSDISSSSMNKAPHEAFKNNGLYYVPLSGSRAGKVFQIASAPTGAELTGPSFSPDGKSLFLSVQHPGEGTTRLEQPLSHWPGGGNSLPRAAVVSIQLP